MNAAGWKRTVVDHREYEPQEADRLGISFMSGVRLFYFLKTVQNVGHM